MQEIERKFLVNSLDFINQATQAQKIAQGYLNSNAERTVRIRIKDQKGFITIKGIGNIEGTTRFEWEKEIDLQEAEALILLCEKGVISKTRYLIPNGKFTFEVDVFENENKGLIIAEIELNAENESFEKPNWLGEEVTGNQKYYNAYLSNHPFNQWK